MNNQDQPNDLQVRYGKDRHVINPKSINLFCHKGIHDIEVLETPTLLINFTHTQQWAAQAPDEIISLVASSKAAKLVTYLLDGDMETYNTKCPKNTSELRGQGTGFKHGYGLILMLMIQHGIGLTPHLQYPETGLHPNAQLNVTDIIIFFSGNADLFPGLSKIETYNLYSEVAKSSNSIRAVIQNDPMLSELLLNQIKTVKS